MIKICVPWMKVEVNKMNTRRISMSEAVTVPSLMMMTSMVLLARDTDRQTNRQTDRDGFSLNWNLQLQTKRESKISMKLKLLFMSLYIYIVTCVGASRPCPCRTCWSNNTPFPCWKQRLQTGASQEEWREIAWLTSRPCARGTCSSDNIPLHCLLKLQQRLPTRASQGEW